VRPLLNEEIWNSSHKKLWWWESILNSWFSQISYGYDVWSSQTLV